MRYLLRRVLATLGFAEPDKFRPLRGNVALGHLSVVLLLRALVLFGASLRFAVHLKKYKAMPGMLPLVGGVMLAWMVYILVILWIRNHRPHTFLGERCQFVQLFLDVVFISTMYWLTQNPESDFFLFFVIPLMLPTTMDWKWRSFASLGASAAGLFTLVLLMPHAKEAAEAAGAAVAEHHSLIKDMLRVFAPRMVFMTGVWLAVNVMIEYRKDAAEESQEKSALQDLLDDMRRRAVPAAPAPAAPAAGAVGADAAAGGNGGSSPAAILAVGQTLASRYELLQPLGRGGMGEVFKANDRELDDIIALKVLSSDKPLPDGTQGIASLKQEIRMARRITHQNVVRVHELSEWMGLRFITMEYVPGTTLRSFLGRGKGLPLGPYLQIFKQLCVGLAAVHEAGIIHRDIKPENVMVLPNGMLKVMDFGFALVEKDGDDAANQGFVVGSPYYMSPEQLRREPLDMRSDIYSVGVLMFELATGVHPFKSEKLAMLIEKQVAEPAPPPSQFQPDIPPPLEQLILACLEKSRDTRPKAALDVYASLLNVHADTA